MVSYTFTTQHWSSGDTALLRTVVENGRVGSVLPTTVVQDSDDLVALYLAPGTTCKRRAGKRGGPHGRVLVEDSGGHEDWTWSENRRLILWHPPELQHAVSLFWRDADNMFLGWYVDVLKPLRRTPLGFDTRDLILDVVIDPDRTWNWKDEDELAWHQEQGYIAPHEAEAIRNEGKRSVSLLEAHDPLFDDIWTLWRPDPGWGIPDVTEGWSVVSHS